MTSSNICNDGLRGARFESVAEARCPPQRSYGAGCGMVSNLAVEYRFRLLRQRIGLRAWQPEENGESVVPEDGRRCSIMDQGLRRGRAARHGRRWSPRRT